MANRNQGNRGATKPDMTKRALKRVSRKRANDWNKQKQRKINENPGYGKEYFEETEYYLENGLRKVIPYNFTFISYVKERWYGRTILDVFSDEFRYMTRQQYKEVLNAGNVTVNGRKIQSNFVLAYGDLIEHTIHRHENPVVSSPIEVIENNDDVLVVNKPSSMPVHPCGHYRHNSLVFILGKEMGTANLRTIYRLDRLTSGVLVFGKSDEYSKKLEDHVRERKTEKEYVCRVVGEFPPGSLECSKPLDVLSHKLGLHKVSDKGKECHTVFERICYNGVSSVVKCMPTTGRTHQIRVHLQYLGFPIVNDPLYNSDVWGKDKGKGGNYHKSMDKLIADISKLHSRDIFDMDLRQGTSLDERDVVRVIVSAKPEGDKAKKETTDKAKKEKGDEAEAEAEAESTEEAGKETTGEGKTESSDEAKNEDTDEATQEDSTESKTEVSTETKTEGSDETKMEVTENVKSQAGDAEIKVDDDKSKNGLSVAKFAFDSDNVNSMCDLSDEQIVEKLDNCTDSMCLDCKRKFRDPKPEELVMYLHAYKYKGPDWEFSAPMPDWADEDWVDVTGKAS